MVFGTAAMYTTSCAEIVAPFTVSPRSSSNLSAFPLFRSSPAATYHPICPLCTTVLYFIKLAQGSYQLIAENAVKGMVNLYG